MRKISPPPGFDPQTIQPVARRYTDYATRPAILLQKSHEIGSLTQFTKYKTLGITGLMFVLDMFKEVTVDEDCRFLQLLIRTKYSTNCNWKVAE